MPYTLFIFLLAGFTQGVSGFGAGLVAMPLLTLVLGIKAAVPLSMLNGLIITGYLSLQLKGHIDWRKILPLLIGCQPGIFLGALALKSMNADLLQLGLGAFISLYAIYSLSTPPKPVSHHGVPENCNLPRKCKRLQGAPDARKRPASYTGVCEQDADKADGVPCDRLPKPRTVSPRWGYIAGFLTGVISSVFSAGGPPAVIYVSLTGWAKDEIKATLSVFFFVSGIITAIGHAINGLTTPAVLQHFAWTAPITLTGVLAGSLLYRRIKQRTYIATMLWLLILMGVMMIVIAGYRLLGQL